MEPNNSGKKQIKKYIAGLEEPVDGLPLRGRWLRFFVAGFIFLVAAFCLFPSMQTVPPTRDPYEVEHAIGYILVVVGAFVLLRR